MILPKTWHRTALGLGIGWSLLWNLVLSGLPLVDRLDLYFCDRLLFLTHPRTPPPEIRLVAIAQPDLTTWSNTTDPLPYSTLIQRLLDVGAKGIILNLLPNWVQTADHPHHPIKTLIQHHRDRLVLVLPTSSATQLNPIEWRSYQYFLPTAANGEPLVPPQSVLGFAEYEPEEKYPHRLSSPARQANLIGQFIYTHNPNGLLTLDSFARLSLQKFGPQPQRQSVPTAPIQLQFWGATGTFPTLSAQAILGDRTLAQSLRDKIVLVGFSDIRSPDTFAVQSPFGDLMPAVEWQANLLASVLTQKYLRLVPVWLRVGGIFIGSLGLSFWLVWGSCNPTRRRGRYWLFPLLLPSTFLLLVGILWSQQWLWPIPLPLLTWCLVGVSVLFSIRFGRQQQLIAQQQCEIDRLHTVEQTAIISQMRKLMHRLASDIHDGPLQELKVIMDRLELLQMQSPALPLDPVLDQLSALGNHLRDHLSQSRQIALAMTPELRDGLAAGIRLRLAQLVESGELTLPVVQRLHALEEPTLNSLWLETREDLFRFFNEAIHNVIRHAQPPNGNATELIVTLAQHGDRCTLALENDGDVLKPSDLAPTPQQRQRGGYGTKLLDTIAAELPEGSLKRTLPPSGGLRLELTWTQFFRL